MTERDSSDGPSSESTDPGTQQAIPSSVVVESSVDQEKCCYHRDAFDVTYEEARRVVKYQLDSVSDINSKAAHTLRVLFILFGLLVTASSLLVNVLLRQPMTNLETAKRFVNSFTATGIVLLLVSLFVAIWTYNETHTRSGLSPVAVRALSHDAPRERRFRQLLSRFPEWMLHNETAIRRDSTLLFVSHFTMFLGLVSLIAGVVTELRFDFVVHAFRIPFPLSYWLLVSGLVVFGFGLLDRHPLRLHRFLSDWSIHIDRATVLRIVGFLLVLVGVGVALLG